MNPLPRDAMVRLRWPRADDAHAIFAYAQDPDMAQTYWLPIPFQAAAADARQLVAEMCRGWTGRAGLTVVIAEPATDRLIGVLLLSKPASIDGATAEIAYGVAPAHRNRGVATHALQLLAPWAFAELGLSRLELRIGLLHGVSQRVARKAGFVREGVVRTRVPVTGVEYDDVVYALST
jgi:RimJ/RimL family protein N-acetyltransferase